jgi:hypothetical protein
MEMFNGIMSHVIAMVPNIPNHHAMQTKQLNGLVPMELPTSVKSVMVNAIDEHHTGIINK